MPAEVISALLTAGPPLPPGGGKPGRGLRFLTPHPPSQQQGTSQENSTMAFQRNNGIELDLFNSAIKVTRKYYSSYLCGLVLFFFFFLATSFFSFDGPVIPRTMYATDPACIQSCY